MSTLSMASNVPYELRILSWEGYTPSNKIAQFKALIFEKHNINLEVNIQYVSSSDDFFEKIRKKEVDLIFPSHNIIKDPRYKLLNRKLIIPINLDQIKNYSNISKDILNNITHINAGNIYFIPMIYGPYGLIYNTDYFSNPPDTWQVLWDEKSKHKYSINSDFYELNIYIAALAAGLSFKEVTDIEKLKSKQVQNDIYTLVKNSKTLWRGIDNPTNLDGHILATSWGISANELVKRSNKWRMACPKEGTTIWVDGVSITRTLENQPFLKMIAESFIDFVISDSYQENVVHKALNSLPANRLTFDRLRAQQKLPDYVSCINFGFISPILSQQQRRYMEFIWIKAIRS
jgi:spermidine/putrescine transport system substrate-binding protein